MSADTNDAKPISILIAAMGGEGGGVLADWIIHAAGEHNFPVQSTSVPGVAQRTGATTYYLEVFPVSFADLGATRPVLSLTPCVGCVDIVAASELVEAGRMMQRGFVSKNRTVLVGSTHREFSVSEKMAMADGRYDSSRILKAADQLALRSILFDMRRLATKHGTVINTVIFGAMVASGILPLSRQACESAIRHSGKAVESSLKGFAAGFDAVTQGVLVEKPVTAAARALPASDRVRALPLPVQEIAAAGVAQTTDFQGSAYASLYLDRVEETCRYERAAESADFLASTEAARYLALWMSYEDVIRVADLKTRWKRLELVRREVGARQDEPVLLTEYLKPGLDEICSILPPALSKWVFESFQHKAARFSKGLHLRTNTIRGFALLCFLRSLKPWRPRSARYATEQAMITRWLLALQQSIPHSLALAHEIALCGNLVKGYGQTSERGHRNLNAILNDLFDSIGQTDTAQLTERVRQARTAALSDPQGRALAKALGLPAPEPEVKPIRFHRKPKAA